MRTILICGHHVRGPLQLRPHEGAPQRLVPANDCAGQHAQEVQPPENLRALEASAAAADLVICQTGCLSHGAYWHLQDHCTRTGKACVLVEQPDALRIVRLHRDGDKMLPSAAITAVSDATDGAAL